MFNINGNNQAQQGGQPAPNWEEMNRRRRESGQGAPAQPQPAHGMGGFGMGGMMPPMPVPFAGGLQLWGQGRPGFGAMTSFHQPPHQVPAHREAAEAPPAREERPARPARRGEQSRTRQLEREKENMQRINFEILREIAAKNSEIAAKNAEIAAKNSEIDAKNAEIAAKNNIIERLQEANALAVAENALLSPYREWWLRTQQNEPSTSTSHPSQGSSNDDDIIIELEKISQRVPTMPFEEAFGKWAIWASGKKMEKTYEKIDLSIFLFDQTANSVAPRIVWKVTAFNLYRVSVHSVDHTNEWRNMAADQKRRWKNDTKILEEWQNEQEAIGLISPRTAEEVNVERMSEVPVKNEPAP